MDKSELDRHIKGLQHLRDDIRMRAEIIDPDGGRVAPVGNGAWIALNDAIEFLLKARESHNNG